MIKKIIASAPIVFYIAWQLPSNFLGVVAILYTAFWVFIIGLEAYTYGKI